MAKSDVLYDHPRSKKAREEEQQAKKGDVRDMDFEDQDGPHRIELKGKYESLGSENQPEGSREKISDEDKKEMSEDLDAWIKSGKKGPGPSFKSPNEDKSQYEIWRRKKKRDIPTS